MRFPPRRSLAQQRRGAGATTLHAGRSLLAIALLAPLIAAIAFAQDPPAARNVLTAEDLIRLSKENVGDALIIELVNAAGELPNLGPDDVIELRKAGVSQNVLTAVIQRNSAATARRPEITGQPRRRRIRVAAILEAQKRSLFNRLQEKDAVEKIQVSWGIQARSWSDGSALTLASSPSCPQDPWCSQRDPQTGQCLHQSAADTPEWRERYGCYADARLTAFGEKQSIFEVELPQPAMDLRVGPFFRQGSDLAPWVTRGAQNGSGKRLPGQVRLQLFGSEDFDLDLEIKLLMSPGGFVQDMQVSECHVVNRDEASMERRILSQDRQYCTLVEARW
jgi:hypothetical protein